LIVGLLFVGVGYWRSHDAVDAASSTRSNNGRLQVWKRAALIFAHNPLSGIGLGATEIPLKVHSAVRPNETSLYLAIEPKNLLLHWADELGIGGIFLFAWLAYAIAKSLRGCKEDVAIALGGAWLAVLAAGMTDTPFGLMNRSSGNVLIGLLLGATLLYSAQSPEPPDVEALSLAKNEVVDA
jgi:O-antigen ligase